MRKVNTIKPNDDIRKKISTIAVVLIILGLVSTILLRNLAPLIFLFLIFLLLSYVLRNRSVIIYEDKFKIIHAFKKSTIKYADVAEIYLSSHFVQNQFSTSLPTIIIKTYSKKGINELFYEIYNQNDISLLIKYILSKNSNIIISDDIESIVKNNAENIKDKLNSGYGYRRNKNKKKNVKHLLLWVYCGIIALLIFLGIILGSNPSDMAMKYYKNGDYTSAVKYYDKVLASKSNNFDALLYKAESLKELGQYKEAAEVYQKAEKENPDNLQLNLGMGYTNYQLGKYNESLRCYNNALKIEPQNIDTILWVVYNNIGIEDYDSAFKFCEQAINMNVKSQYAYNAKGQIYMKKGRYNDAIVWYEKAIEVDSKYEYAYLNKAEALFLQRNYSKCIRHCEDTEKFFPKNENLFWYMGDCYSWLNQYETAISQYKKVLDINPENDDVIVLIGWAYYDLQDYEKAKEYADKALDINTENVGGLNLAKELDKKKKPLSQQIADFVNNNYLYYDKVSEFEEIVKKFSEKDHANINDINDFIMSIKKEDDIFTFVLKDTDYKFYLEQNNNPSIYYKSLNSNVDYLQISSFTMNTDNEFRDIVEKIHNPEEHILVIDLRSNSGGLTKSSNNILDILLPECTTSYLIYRNGRIVPYYSDDNQIKFKKIFILVDEYSASSSELLTLGLKKYLNNITIIGKPTYGKGVGQVCFEDKKNGYMIFLVNHYWNVKEQNIMNDKIYPDILIKGSEDKDYLDVLFNEVSKIK